MNRIAPALLMAFAGNMLTRSAVLAAPGATAEAFQALEAQIKKLEAEAEKRRKSDEERERARLAERDRRVTAFDRADAALAQAEGDFRRHGAARRTADLSRLKTARTTLVDAALSAYVLSDGPGRQRILRRLEITVSRGQSWQTLLESLQNAISTGEGDSAEMLSLLDAARDKLRLARMLSRQENRLLLDKLIGELRAKYPEVKIDIDRDSYDFARLFDALGDLQQEHVRYLAKRTTTLMGSYEPQERYVRDRIVLAFLVESDAEEKATRPFRKAFAPWFCEMAPEEGECRSRTFVGWTADDVAKLMADAATVLGDPRPPAEVLQACPERVDTIAAQHLDLLCAPQYAGVIAVDIRRGAGGKRLVSVQWRVRQANQEISVSNGFPDAAFQLPDDEVSSSQAGNKLALDVMVDGTVSKRLRRVLRQLAAIDPESLEAFAAKVSDRARAARGSSGAPPAALPATNPAPTTVATRAPPTPPHDVSATSVTTQAVVQTAPRRTAGDVQLRLLPSVVANAGLPLLLDRSKSNDWAGLTLAIADTVSLAGAAGALWQYREAREAFARGETSSLHTADRWYGLAVSAALTYVVVKVVGAACGIVMQRSVD